MPSQPFLEFLHLACFLLGNEVSFQVGESSEKTIFSFCISPRTEKIEFSVHRLKILKIKTLEM